MKEEGMLILVVAILVLSISLVSASCDDARQNYNSCQSYCNQFNHNVSSFQMQSSPTERAYGSSGLCLCSNYLQDNIGCPEILNSTWQPEINCSVALETIGRCGDFCKTKGTYVIGTWPTSTLSSCLCLNGSQIIAQCKTSDAFCTDSDGGVDLYVKGTLTSNPRSGESVFKMEDQCYYPRISSTEVSPISTEVMEAWCIGTVPYWERVVCPDNTFCQEGICGFSTPSNQNNSNTLQNQTNQSSINNPTISSSAGSSSGGGGGGGTLQTANLNKNVSSELGISAKVNQQPIVSSGGGGESSTFNVDTQESKVIGSGGVVATSVIKISSSDGKAYATKEDGVKTEIKVDPTNAVNLARENLKSVDIKGVRMVEYKSKIVYEVSAEKQVKILALIKSNMEIKTNVDVESGEIIGVEKPWWSFLATGA